MRNIFRSLDRFGVEYLLISGQACVLYGAATFSEDIDIWLRPAPRNVNRLLRALASCRALVHKLTPPLQTRHILAGHGFHFVVPGGSPAAYLDVMGWPPRVGAFEQAARRRARLDSDWGRLPVAAIEDVVELKKTRRQADYDVITNLVQVRLAAEESPPRRLLKWALRNSFRAEERAEIAARLGRPADSERLRSGIAAEIAALQARDARYWRKRVRDLRRLRRDGILLPVGLPVRDLVRTM